jgi:hypothetical protein
MAEAEHLSFPVQVAAPLSLHLSDPSLHEVIAAYRAVRERKRQAFSRIVRYVATAFSPPVATMKA